MLRGGSLMVMRPPIEWRELMDKGYGIAVLTIVADDKVFQCRWQKWIRSQDGRLWDRGVPWGFCCGD